MPAVPSSLIDALAGRSSIRDSDHTFSAMGGAPDPRRKRGIRFATASILAVAVAVASTGAGPTPRSVKGLTTHPGKS